MAILVYVGEPGRTTLRAAVGRHALFTFDSCEEFIRAVSADPTAVAVLDPLVFRRDQYLRLIGALAVRPSRHVIMTTLEGAAPARLMAAAIAGPCEVIFHGIDTDPAVLRFRLLELKDWSGRACTLNRIAPAIARLAPELQVHLIAVYGGAAIPHRVGEFVSAMPIARRSVARKLNDAGLHSPSKILVGARVGRAAELLIDAHMSVEEAARRADYRRADRMRVQFGDVFEYSPKIVSRTYDADAVADAVARYILR